MSGSPIPHSSQRQHSNEITSSSSRRSKNETHDQRNDFLKQHKKIPTTNLRRMRVLSKYTILHQLPYGSSVDTVIKVEANILLTYVTTTHVFTYNGPQFSSTALDHFSNTWAFTWVQYIYPRHINPILPIIERIKR